MEFYLVFFIHLLNVLFHFIDSADCIFPVEVEPLVQFQVNPCHFPYFVAFIFLLPEFCEFSLCLSSIGYFAFFIHMVLSYKLTISSGVFLTTFYSLNDLIYFLYIILLACFSYLFISHLDHIFPFVEPYFSSFYSANFFQVFFKYDLLLYHLVFSLYMCHNFHC